MNKILLILPLVAIIAISGCVQGDNAAPTGNGMVINEFSSSLDSVNGGGDSVTLYLEAENEGGFTIDSAKGCLIGSNTGTSGTGADIYKQGLWELTATKYLCQALDADKTLRPSDPANNIPGGTFQARWYLKSPCLAETLSRADEFTGRVFYKYNTTTSTSVWVYKETELTAAQQKGESIPSSLVVQSTRGPVSISMEAVQPVRADDGSVTLRVTLSNDGNGVVFDETDFPWSSSEDSVPEIAEGKLNVFSATISTGSDIADVSECFNELSDIELRKGQSVTKSCEITIDDTKVSTKSSFPLELTATYGYYIDGLLSIASSGKKNDAECD